MLGNSNCDRNTVLMIEVYTLGAGVSGFDLQVEVFRMLGGSHLRSYLISRGRCEPVVLRESHTECRF